MGKALILNDTHFGVQRGTGTTPASAQKLNQWMHLQHQHIINDPQFQDCDLIYNGDVFDKFQVPLKEAAMLVQTWSDWLKTHKGTITVGMGNHDIAKDSAKLSIFEFVCRAMCKLDPIRFGCQQELGKIYPHVYMLPHRVNQETFDEELLEFIDTHRDCILLLHANWDDEFAVNNDHSLNVSAVRAAAANENNIIFLFGHQHDFEVVPDYPNVIIPGNQIPTSIADFKNCQEKFFVVLDGLTDMWGIGGKEEITLQLHQLYTDMTIFKEVKYEDLDGENFDPQSAMFLHVTGEFERKDLPAAMDKIAKLRAKLDDVFIITTKFAVKGELAVETLEVSGDDLKAVDVMDYVYGNVKDEQAAVIKLLMSKVEA